MQTVNEKPAVTARAVKNGAKENALFVAPTTDGLWATNRFWLVPVERVARLLWEYNLPSNEPGAYTVNGKVTRDERDHPRIQGILDDARSASLTLTRETLDNGKPLFVQGGKGQWLALYLTEDGHRIALDSAYVDWITPPWGTVTLRTSSPTRPVSFFYVDKGDSETFIGCVMPVRLSS